MPVSIVTRGGGCADKRAAPRPARIAVPIKTGRGRDSSLLVMLKIVLAEPRGEDRRLALGGAAWSCGLFTEDYLLGAGGGAARGCGLFTEDYLLGALSGAAGSDGRQANWKDVVCSLSRPQFRRHGGFQEARRLAEGACARALH